MQGLPKSGAKQKASAGDAPLGESSQSTPAPLLARPSKKRMLSTAGEGVKTALKLLKECFDSVPVPGVKAAVGGILELIRIFENVTENQDELVQLATRINALKTHVEQSAGHFAQGFLPQLLQSNATGLVRPNYANALNDMAKDAERVFGKSRANRTANHDAHKAMIQALNTKLDRMIASVSMDTYQRIESMLDDGFVQVQAQADDDVIHRPPRAKARYDSSLRRGARRCLEGTRVGLLDTIHGWIDGTGPYKEPIFWLSGEAGTGKSTVAHTIAEDRDRTQQLGASFFFSRNEEARRDVNLFVSTLAYQLSIFNREFKTHLAASLRSDPAHTESKVAKQLNKMVIMPLKKTRSFPDGPIVVVVDALDECTPDDGAEEILEAWVELIQDFPLRLLVTSRPSWHIRGKIESSQHLSAVFHLHDIAISVVQADVEHYFRESLVKVDGLHDLLAAGALERLHQETRISRT